MSVDELPSQKVAWMGGQSVSELVADFRASRRNVLAVDGFMGSGKTPISLMLEFLLGIGCTHVDDYLPSDTTANKGRPFLEVLNLNRLQTDIRGAASTGPAVVEGILVRDVLSRVYADSPAYHVYVAAVWSPSKTEVRWNEGDRLRLGASNDELDAQIVEYHRRLGPQINFDRSLLRDQDRFSVNSTLLSPDGQQFAIPHQAIQESGIKKWRRRGSAYQSADATAVNLPLGLIDPRLPVATPDLPRDRMKELISAIVQGNPIAPVKVSHAQRNGIYNLIEGHHRYFASITSGFTRLPAILASG